MDVFVDYYEILGVSQDADVANIREAYLKIKERATIEQWKPSKLSAIETAHGILSQPVRRHEYDSQRACIDITVDSADVGKNSIFSASRVKTFLEDTSTRDGRRKGKDVKVEVKLSLAEVYHGGKKCAKFEVTYPCKVCAMRCTVCKGSGDMFIQKRIAPVFNQRTQIDCYSCLGKGYTFRKDALCVMCHGERQYTQLRQCTLNFDPGVEHGHEILLRGYGEQVLNGECGNLVFVVNTCTNDRLIKRNMHNIQCTLPIHWIKTLTGIKYKLNLPCGIVVVDTREFKEIIQPGKWYVIPNKGLPIYNQKTKTIEGYGHVGVQFIVMYDAVNAELWNDTDELKRLESELVSALMGSRGGVTHPII
jgi:molecular chaperone DnaJ